MKYNVLHILPSSSPHLSNPIARNFIKNIRNDDVYIQKAIILGGTNKDKYRDLIKEQNGSIIEISSRKDLLYFLLKQKEKHIIVHGDMLYFLLFLVLLCNNVNWVCWGSGTKTNKSLFSKLTYPIKWLIFHRLQSIITLMKDDKDDLVRTYNLKNVRLMPYSKSEDLYYSDLKHFNKLQNNPIRVLVGNSGHNYDSYLQILPLLARYKGKIKVHCMFQYPNFQEKKKKLLDLGNKLFGDDFYIDECMMDRHSYYDYMASYDIYICHSEVQTGLGAIYNSLFFGKKVFLNGRNLSWCQSLGYKVYDTKILYSINLDEFLKDLTTNEKLNNREILLKFREKKTDEWKDFLLMLTKS